MKNQIIIKKLGVGIRKLRKIRDIKVAVLAQKLGYLSVEAYLKLERGEKNDIGIVHLLAICEELNCSISNLFILSGLTDNLFNKEITSWSQFLDSLTDVPAERKEKILELLNTLNFSQSVT
jgi:transcriptional regulator with XRE-family HTH domain